MKDYAMSKLVERFENFLPIKIEKDGFPWPPLFALHHDDTVTLAVMTIPHEQIFSYACKMLSDLTIKELIFCVDQFTKPNQGTKYDDALIVFWWCGEYTENYGFRFGVVNYRPPPNTLIEPIDWNNVYWNEKMLEIVAQDYQRTERAIERIRKTNPDAVDRITQIVETIAKKQRGEMD